MSGTYVSNGTPGKVYVQNLVFDDNSIKPSATVGNGNVNINTNEGNNVVVNKLNITRDSVNTAVIMSTVNDNDHVVLRSGNGNIYLGTVDNNVKSTTLSLIGDSLRSDDSSSGNIKLLSGSTGSTNIDNTFYVNNGNIGIGKSVPTTKLDVVGSIKLTGTLLKTDGTPYVINTWGKTGNDLYYSAGNAIIGSIGTPSGKFDIVSSTGRGLVVTGDVGSSGTQASFTGSSNTMLLRSGNSSSSNYVFSIEKSDNSSVFRVGNDGLVGVGNNAPSYGLDVAVSARMSHSLEIAGTGLSVSADGETVKLVGTSSCYVGLYPDSPSLRKGYFGYDEGVLKFDSESSSRHFTFSGGNVGLKTLTPDYNLTINAGSTDSSLGVGNNHAFGIVGSNDQEALWMGYDAVVDAGYLNVSNADGAVPLLLQNLGGSVGIGSSIPLGRLDVRKGTATSSGWEAASFGAETSANDLVVVGNYNNRAVIAGKNATMSADANLVLAPTGGNVGVGSMSPGYKLDVNGDVNLTGTLYQDGNAVALSSFYESGGNVYLNSGNFGIGNSSPSYDIDVTGDINYTGNLYKNGTLVSAGSGLWTANGSDIYFSGGNVGIGTTSPAAKLDVAGLIKADHLSLGIQQYPNVGGQWLTINLNTYNANAGPNAPEPEGGIMFSNIDTNSIFKWGYYMGVVKPSASDQSNSQRLDIGRTIDVESQISGGTIGTFIPSVTVFNDNVGIGTISPTSRLTINSGSTSNANGELAYHGFAVTTGTNDQTIWMGYDGSVDIGYINCAKYGHVMPICLQTRGGTVGIGTTDPKAKMHINGGGGSSAILGTNANPRSYFRYDRSALTFDYDTWSMSGVSLYASSDIVSSSWIVSHGSTTFSDTRIKKDIVDIDDASALETIRLIKPKKYSYVDTVAKGTEPVWGFIAQEVKSTLDYAVNLMEKAIPNIFCLANVLDNGNVIEISNFNTANLQRNDDGTLIVKLQLMSWDNREVEVEINNVLSSSRIRLTKPLEENVYNGTIGNESIVRKVFVYGQWVDDFHVLKKDAIFTVAVAALQEVDRRQTIDNERILELEGDIAVVQTELQTTRTELQTTRTELQTTRMELQTTRTELHTTRTELADTKAQMESILARLTALENA